MRGEVAIILPSATRGSPRLRACHIMYEGNRVAITSPGARPMIASMPILRSAPGITKHPTEPPKAFVSLK